MADSVTATTTRDNLISGDFPIVKDTVTIGNSQTLLRGALLGKLTSGGNAVASDSTASDGSQTLYGILLDDSITTGASETKPATVALCGGFLSQGLKFVGTDTYLTRKAEARALNMYFKTSNADHNVGE